MLIWTGTAAWALSAVAQIGAILFNNEISKEQKSFLIPQELADAAVNIGSYLVITKSVQSLVTKLFTSGKWAPKEVKAFMNKHKDVFADKGKFDFNLDNGLSDMLGFPAQEYKTYKEFGKTASTVVAGIVASNIVTPLARNAMASTIQKRYITHTSSNSLEKPQSIQPAYGSTNLKI